MDKKSLKHRLVWKFFTNVMNKSRGLGSSIEDIRHFSKNELDMIMDNYGYTFSDKKKVKYKLFQDSKEFSKMIKYRYNSSADESGIELCVERTSYGLEVVGIADLD